VLQHAESTRGQIGWQELASSQPASHQGGVRLHVLLMDDTAHYKLGSTPTQPTQN
jgi:hypothetical protein